MLVLQGAPPKPLVATKVSFDFKLKINVLYSLL